MVAGALGGGVDGVAEGETDGDVGGVGGDGRGGGSGDVAGLGWSVRAGSGVGSDAVVCPDGETDADGLWSGPGTSEAPGLAMIDEPALRDGAGVGAVGGVEAQAATMRAALNASKLRRTRDPADGTAWNGSSG